jgi:hypothetical protein
MSRCAWRIDDQDARITVKPGSVAQVFRKSEKTVEGYRKHARVPLEAV